MSTTTPLSIKSPAKPRPVPRWLQMSRSRAFLSHLALSASIVGAVCGLIFFVWYPHPYFDAVGAARVLRVLIGVDLVLGPLLTLILFKPGKWGLKFDVAFIAALQLTALVYGITVIYSQRPYFAVFAVDRFTVLARTDVDEARWREALATNRVDPKPWRAPLLVVASLPKDDAALQRLIEETVFGGAPDIERRPEFWRRYSEQTTQAIARRRSLDDLQAARPEAARVIAGLPARLGRPADQLGFLPVVAKNRDMSMIVDGKTGLPLEVIDIDPWISDPG
jgi:hypothetical protein